MKEKALNYYKNGSSCSESIVLAAADEGLCDKNLLPVATSFSAGMSSGCLCGAVAGAQLVLGANFGKSNLKGNEESARLMAKEFIEEFKAKRHTTCCRALSANFDFNSPERKENCASLVKECAEILEKLVKIKV